MAKRLTTQREELERTKKELKQLKSRELSEISEDIKFVRDVATMIDEFERPMIELQKKRCVTFSNLPSFSINTEGQVLQRQFTLDREAVAPMKKKKKKPLIPLMAVIFSKKKSLYHEHASSAKVQG